MSKKLSLLSTIIININIMLGAGIFINGPVLAEYAGGLSPFVYLIVGLLVLPLILGIAKLLTYFKENGTFYHFGTTISPFFGFLSSWCYFIAKLSSAGLGIHICITFLQKVIPYLDNFSALNLDLITIFLFVCLNLLNFKTNQAILYYFIFTKLVPILFIILSGIYLFHIENIVVNLNWSGVPLAIPLVLYVFSGFEASCSLSQHIENPEKNGPKAILISFFFVVATTFLYQAAIYGAIGPVFNFLKLTYLDIFPSFCKLLFGDNPISFCHNYSKIYNLLHIFIATTALGSSYGILYSNSWNLHALSDANHVFFPHLFSRVNRFGMATFCVLAEGILAASFLLITGGSQVPMQQVSSLGSAIAYTLSIVALFVLLYRKRENLFLPILGLFSCALLLGSYLYTNIAKGPSNLLLIYFLIIILGTYMFYVKHKSRKLKEFSEF